MIRRTSDTIGYEDRREPTWEIAMLYPAQGDWSIEEYLSLPTNRLVEYDAGALKFLPMPTELHQAIVAFLYSALSDYAKASDLGKVIFAPLPIEVAPRKHREPDVALMLSKNASRRKGKYWEGADLVVEVLSEGNRDRDLVTKRGEYAAAGISEYWIVDPQEGRIVVLKLSESSYTVHGEFSTGQTATSALLPGFAISVTRALETE